MPAIPESYDICDAHRFFNVAILAYFRSALDYAFLEFEAGDLLEFLSFSFTDFFLFEPITVFEFLLMLRFIAIELLASAMFSLAFTAATTAAAFVD